MACGVSWLKSYISIKHTQKAAKRLVFYKNFNELFTNKK